MKRGQVTLFIILAIVILIIIALVSYYFKDISANSLKDLGLPTEVRLYKENTQNCIESITEDAIRIISSQGGYYTLPEDNFEGITAYYYVKAQKYIPSLTKVNEELTKYVEDNLNLCVISTSTVQSEITDKKVTTSLLEDSISFKVTLNTKLSFKDKEYEINEPYNIVQPTPFLKSYNIATQIIDIQMQDQENLCYSCILQIAKENDVQININSLGESLLFTIENQGDEFNFANKY